MKIIFVFIMLVTLNGCGSQQSDKDGNARISNQIFAQYCCPVEQIWGTNDNFALPQDVAPVYLSPAFSAYLNTIGVPPSKQKTFDSMAMDRHFVQSLRHGLSQSTIDAMCSFGIRIRAKTILAGPYSANNDSVSITATTNYSSGPVEVVATVPVGVHNTGAVYDKYIDLKPFSAILGGKIYMDVRVQDDTAIDYIAVSRGKVSSTPCLAPSPIPSPL